MGKEEKKSFEEAETAFLGMFNWLDTGTASDNKTNDHQKKSRGIGISPSNQQKTTYQVKVATLG